MTFDEVLAQVLELLQQEKRVSYRALKLRFDINDDYIEGIKDELIYAKKWAVDEDNRVLVWTSNVAGTTALLSPSPQSIPSPLTQATPSVEATSPVVTSPTPDAERRQLTVMFCDLVDSTTACGQCHRSRNLFPARHQYSPKPASQILGTPCRNKSRSTVAAPGQTPGRL